jgi:hypothetical protein
VTRRFARFDGSGDVNGASVQQQLLGERRFPRIGVRYDGERSAFFHFLPQFVASRLAHGFDDPSLVK